MDQWRRATISVPATLPSLDSNSQEGCGMPEHCSRVDWRLNLGDQHSSFFEDIQQHPLRQFAGVGVLQRRMIGAQENAPGGQRVLSSVDENISGLRLEQAVPLQIIEVSVESNLAQNGHHLYPAEFSEFAIEEGRAASNFIGIGLILRRCAADGGCDVGIVKFQAVTAMSGRRLRGKARLVKNAIEEVPGAVAGKGTAGPVGAVRSRSQRQNQQARLGIAPSWNRFGPVLPVEIGTTLLARDLAAMRDQPRTSCASDDLSIQLTELLLDDRTKLAGGSHASSLAAYGAGAHSVIVASGFLVRPKAFYFME